MTRPALLVLLLTALLTTFCHVQGAGSELAGRASGGRGLVSASQGNSGRKLLDAVPGESASSYAIGVGPRYGVFGRKLSDATPGESTGVGFNVGRKLRDEGDSEEAPVRTQARVGTGSTGGGGGVGRKLRDDEYSEQPEERPVRTQARVGTGSTGASPGRKLRGMQDLEDTRGNRGRKLLDAVPGESSGVGINVGRKLLDAVPGESTGVGINVGRKLLDAVPGESASNYAIGVGPCYGVFGRKLSDATPGESTGVGFNVGRKLDEGDAEEAPVRTQTRVGTGSTGGIGRKLQGDGFPGYWEEAPRTQTRVGTGSTGGGAHG